MPRLLRIALIVIVTLSTLTLGGYYLVLHTLKTQVIRLLGEQSEYSAIDVNLHTITIEKLRIRTDRSMDSAKNFPSADELRAERVVIEPDLRSLLTDNILIRRIGFEEAYLPIMRLSGRVRFLPSLLENRREARAARGEPEGLPPKKYVHVAHVDIEDSDIDFYDATLSGKPHRIPMRKVKGTLKKLKFPTLDEEAELDLDGVTSANGNKGSIKLVGNIVPRTRDSKLRLQLRGMDLKLLQPYFVKRTPAQIEAGTLDMDMQSTVRDRVLHAPGTFVLHNLKMGGGFEFGNFSRKLALGILKDDQDRIELSFTMSGSLKDPKFSLNEELYTRVGTALAGSLGVSIESLGKGVLGVGEGIGTAIRSILE